MAFKLSALFAFCRKGRSAFPEISGFVATGTIKDGYPCYRAKDPLDKVKGTVEGSVIMGASDIRFNRSQSAAPLRRRLSDPHV